MYFVLLKKEGKDTGRWTGDLKVDGDLASNCDLLAEFQPCRKPKLMMFLEHVNHTLCN